jgi:hypothetical protein
LLKTIPEDRFILLMEWIPDDWLIEAQFPEELFANESTLSWTRFPDDDPPPPSASPRDPPQVPELKDLPKPFIPTLMNQAERLEAASARNFDPFEEPEQRQPISSQARCEMNQWVIDHANSPFLSKEKEDYFMEKYNLTRRQVKTAFNNRRQRIIVPSRRRVETLQRNFQEQFLIQLAALGVFGNGCWRSSSGQ